MKTNSIKLLINFLILFIVYSSNVFSQNDIISLKQNNLYIELGGSGGFGSINFERIIYSKEYLSFRVLSGIGTINIMDYTNKFNPDILFPVMFTTTLGKINNFEMGVGETISLLVKANSSSFKKERILNFSTIINIGYRYYPKNQNVFFRVTYTPIIFQNKYYRNWAGLSVGYRF